MIQEYIESARKNQEDLSIRETGLFIDCERPYLGASPDGIVICKCCGKGVVEVKCPFCIRDA